MNKLNIIQLFSFVLVCGIALLYSLETPIVSISESTVATAQVGKILKVDFIANKVQEFNVQISSVAGSVETITETVTLVANSYLVSREFDIPNDESWVGEAILKISYNAGGQLIEKTKEILFTESNPVMYVVGGSIGAGWEPTLAVPMKLYDSESKNKFETFEYITVGGDGFKFLPTNVDWEGAFGYAGTDGVLLQDGGAGNITVEEDGFYRIRMDAEAGTYELLKTSWGVIGSATPGGWDSDTDMAFSGGRGTYTWTVRMNLVEGELKFRANDDWPINVGGTAANLTQDGDNIAISSAGVYDIELHLSPSGYTASITKN
jgi:hypothetical protein